MTTIQTSPSLTSFAERFWAKVKKTRACWNWTAGCFNHPRGGTSYGCFYLGSRTDGTRKMHPAHRVAYELSVGAVPPGMKVLHKCDNPRCVNPAHLFLGTQRQNVDDMVAKGRAWWQAGGSK
jgi:hypothetical protein